MFLTAEELKLLTGRCRTRTQIAALRGMGIEHKINAAGKVLVSRQHAEAVMAGKSGEPVKTSTFRPNWDAVRNAKAASR
jgi:hypothetical protein